MKKLSVHLVSWNGAKYIPYLFDSLRKQTYSDWQLIVLDNASTDNTANLIKKELENFLPDHVLIESKENTGFAGGHNMLFTKTGLGGDMDSIRLNSEYVLLLNQDMYITPDCFERMIAYADAHRGISAISPRLMRWNFGAADFKNIENGFSDTIDALGLRVFRSRRVIEQYTGQKWAELKAQFEKKSKNDFVFKNEVSKENILNVFGLSGAFPLLRRPAMNQVLLENGNLFDELYGSYKEDVDLAFRMRSAGQDSVILLDAVAYHDRSAAGPERFSDSAAAQNKKTQSSWVTYNSYKNHLMTLYKNEYWQNTVLDFLWIKWYEVKKFFYFLFFNPKVLTGLLELWKHRKTLRARREYIRRRRKTDCKHIRFWWTKYASINEFVAKD